MALIQFTRNYHDGSTNQGYQFEFFCDRCGNGYKTKFVASTTGTISTALDTASGLLGGILGRAANVADNIRSATWKQEHDKAFEQAIEEAKPHFHKCKRCGHWVDDDCWNQPRGLCKTCTPELEEEYAHEQVQGALRDAREKADQVDYISADRMKQTIVGNCPHCGAELTGGKFCPGCGKPVAAKKFCTECGKEIQAGVKFCPECGAKQG